MRMVLQFNKTRLIIIRDKKQEELKRDNVALLVIFNILFTLIVVNYCIDISQYLFKF